MEIGITLVFFTIALVIGYFIGYKNGKNHLGYMDGYFDGYDSGYNNAIMKHNHNNKKLIWKKKIEAARAHPT